jgi:hypothetical protein
MPVDAVYTWVNHRDQRWQQWYSDAIKMIGGQQQLHQTAANPARFCNRNELYYSIRSVRKNAPWVDRIHILTNCALPYEVSQMPRVNGVMHEDVFPDAGVLPTFNSHAIEANLHRIEGLSEQFIYFNDDVFLSAPVSVSDFFTEDGNPRVFLSNHNIPMSRSRECRPVDHAAINVRELLQRDFGFCPEKKLHHAPFAMCRSVLAEICNRYHEGLLQTMAHRFRDNTDLPLATTLHAYYALATGRASLGKLRCRYIDIGDPLFVLLTHRFSPLRRGKYDVFCLNEVAEFGGLEFLRDRLVRRMLTEMFDE